jgi:hypothetical protein
MNALALRKQLLLAESELNRIQLGCEWRRMTQGVNSIAQRTRTIGSIALASASLMAGLASFRRSKSAPARQKPSWWRTLLKGAQWSLLLWSEFSPRPKS